MRILLTIGLAALALYIGWWLGRLKEGQVPAPSSNTNLLPTGVVENERILVRRDLPSVTPGGTRSLMTNIQTS